MARTKSEIEALLQEKQIELYRLETNPSKLFAMMAELKIDDVKKEIKELEAELANAH